MNKILGISNRNYIDTLLSKKMFSFKIDKLSTTDNIYNGKPCDVLNTGYLNEDVPTHLDSLARFDSESKWAWPNLTQAQLNSFWPNLTLLSPSQNGPGRTCLLFAQFDPTLCFFLAVQLV